MHTLTSNETVFNYNGGFDGNVTIQRASSDGVMVLTEIPFEDIKNLVAEYVRRSKENKLEISTADQILGVK